MLKSPVAYLSDAEFSALPLPERALHVARSQIGVEEVPRGSNWGPKVRLYLKIAGVFGPAAWCAAFVSWCLIQAGCPRWKLPTIAASTYWWIVWARKAGRTSTAPSRGDLFVWNVKGAGHIGFVAEVVDRGIVRTIEGNTNDDGSREGYGVLERRRPIDRILAKENGCFISVRGLDA